MSPIEAEARAAEVGSEAAEIVADKIARTAAVVETLGRLTDNAGTLGSQRQTLARTGASIRRAVHDLQAVSALWSDVAETLRKGVDDDPAEAWKRG